MNTITKIRYIDAKYVTSSTLPSDTSFTVHEAFGYVEPYGASLLLTHIKRLSPERWFVRLYRAVIFGGRAMVVDGLILPSQAVVSRARAVDPTPYQSIPQGTKITIDWYDVVKLANVCIRENHSMRTVGILERIENDRIIVRDPVTVRTRPAPRKPHAQDATFLIIPVAFITTLHQLP